MSGAKLFMIPWLIIVVESQRTPTATPLGADLLIESHHRHFYEMLRRQQQINDAILLNNALLHQQLHIPANPPPPPPPPPEMMIPQHAPPPPAFFNPFIATNIQKEESTSKLGNYGKEEGDVSEKEGTVQIPKRDVLGGVKTVSIQRKEVTTEKQKPSTIPGTTPSTTTTSTTTPMVGLSEEDLEVVQLFKKLNLSKAETKSIVEHVEQVVRDELTRKLKEAEAKVPKDTNVTQTTTESTTKSSTTKIPTTPTTTPLSTPSGVSTTTHRSTTELRNDGGEEEEEGLVIHKNNLKHHPKKKPHLTIAPARSTSSEELTPAAGSIKTSLTHLPIVEPATPDEPDLVDSALHHRRVVIASRQKESDRDLLVDFATGAPLDLSDQELVGRDRLATVTSALDPITTTTTKTTTSKRLTTLPPRQPHHELSNFERLATDYRNRLENTGDINKILQKISENAYISLVEQNGRRKMFRP